MIKEDFSLTGGLRIVKVVVHEQKDVNVIGQRLFGDERAEANESTQTTRYGGYLVDSLQSHEQCLPRGIASAKSLKHIIKCCRVNANGKIATLFKRGKAHDRPRTSAQLAVTETGW